MDKQHIGGDFDDFLRKERLLDDAEATAAKRVIAFQIAQEMKRAGHQVGDGASHEDQQAGLGPLARSHESLRDALDLGAGRIGGGQEA